MRDAAPRRPSRSEGGSALLAVLVFVLVCGAVGATVLLPSLLRQRESEAYVRGQRAFHMAETGVEFGIATIRDNAGALPASGIATTTVPGCGTYTVTFASGDANLIDDDGDGTVDEADEASFVILTSVGEAGPERRAIEVVTQRTVELPEITAAVTINVVAPIVDVKGNRIIVDGRDHMLDGAHDALSAAVFALATPAAVSDITAQLAPNVVDQFLGTSASPSVTQTPLFDMFSLTSNAISASSINLEPGSHANKSLGSPTSDGIEMVFCDGDLHLSGNTGGAGVLVVSGDLVITGNFTWTGLVLVQGTVRMSGGGNSKMIVGALLIGEEVQSIDTDLTLSGTVDLLFSSTAVDLATSGIATSSVLTWREVAAP